MRRLLLITGLVALLAVVCAHAQVRRDGPTDARDEEQAIRHVLAQFYEGWNAHDADKMVSIYADDIDHINVFGQWHKGKADIRKDLTMVHTGPGRNSQRKPVVEKIRLLSRRLLRHPRAVGRHRGSHGGGPRAMPTRRPLASRVAGRPGPGAHRPGLRIATA
jgi:uncharacterized protein (TIGR02246 family)